MAKIEVDEKHLVAARDLLRTTLKNSRALSLSLAETTHTLDHKFRRLTLPNTTTADHLKQHFNWAIRPTDAVLKAFHSVHHLQTSLTSSSPAAHPLSTNYVSTVKSLEEALGFLTNSCTLAIQWLNGTLEFLQRDDTVAAAAASSSRERYLDKVNNCLSTIRKLQAAEQRSRLPGGALYVALTNLEDEFKKLLLETQGRCPTVQKLHPIIQRLSSNDRLDKCVSVFIDVRTRWASETLKSVIGNLDYSEGDSGGFITKWKRHLVFGVREILEKEYLVCREVFVEDDDTWRRCFAGIAVGSGFCKILKVGMRVAEEGRKSPNKLLNMLDMFSSMDEVRPSFGRMFGGRGEYGCKEIQDETRDLVKKVVEGCWDIFWELSYQLELQRQTAPPSDGGVPKLVSFVTHYCNQLLADAYRAPMIQVLMIYQSWKREKYQEGLFTNQIYNVMKQIGLNLDSWSKAYDDRALSYLFMMNNHSHLCSLTGTKLGAMMGESWLKAHHQYRDSCAVLYVKESWDNISMSDTDLRTFNEVFQSMYQKHLQWSIPDEKMRAKVLKSIAESVVPAYRTCLIRHHEGGGGGDSWQVRVRRSPSNGGNLNSSAISIITVQAMEDMIGSLFQGPRKGIGNDYFIKTADKIVNVVADSSRYSFTLTAS